MECEAAWSWALDFVELEEGLGVLRAFDGFLEANLAAAFAAEGIDIVDPMKERGPVETLTAPLRLLLGPLPRLSGISVFLRETVSVSGRIACSHSEAALSFTKRGHGICLLASWLADEEIEKRTLVDLFRRHTTAGAPIRGLTPPGRLVALRVRTLIEHLRVGLLERLGDAPPRPAGVGCTQSGMDCCHSEIVDSCDDTMASCLLP